MPLLQAKQASTAAPSQGIGGGNAAGSSASLAKADHDHTIRETGGPTDLTVGAITDGQFLKRSGSTIVSAAGGASVLVQTNSVALASDTTSTSTSFVDLLSRTLTTGTGFLLIYASLSASNSSQNTSFFYRVLVDGTSIGGGQEDIKTAGGGGTGAVVKRVAVTAGSHTVKIQWKTASGTIQCRPVTAAIDAEHAHILLQEVTA